MKLPAAVLASVRGSLLAVAVSGCSLAGASTPSTLDPHPVAVVQPVNKPSPIATDEVMTPIADHQVLTDETAPVSDHEHEGLGASSDPDNLPRPCGRG